MTGCFKICVQANYWGFIYPIIMSRIGCLVNRLFYIFRPPHLV